MLSKDDPGLADASSLTGACLLPGDLIYLPPCSLLIEKSVQSTNICTRTTPLWMHPRAHRLWFLYRCVFSAPLGSNFKRIGLSHSHSHSFGCEFELWQTLRLCLRAALRDLSADVMSVETTKLHNVSDYISLRDALASDDINKPDQPDEMELTAEEICRFSEEERQEMLSDLSEEDFQNHIDAALRHKYFEEHCEYVRNELIGLNNPDSIDAWKFGDHAGDAFEDLMCWYAWLATKMAGSTESTEATATGNATAATCVEVFVGHDLRIQIFATAGHGDGGQQAC